VAGETAVAVPGMSKFVDGASDPAKFQDGQAGATAVAVPGMSKFVDGASDPTKFQDGQAGATAFAVAGMSKFVDGASEPAKLQDGQACIGGASLLDDMPWQSAVGPTIVVHAKLLDTGSCTCAIVGGA